MIVFTVMISVSLKYYVQHAWLQNTNCMFSVMDKADRSLAVLLIKTSF